MAGGELGHRRGEPRVLAAGEPGVLEAHASAALAGTLAGTCTGTALHRHCTAPAPRIAFTHTRRRGMNRLTSSPVIASTANASTQPSVESWWMSSAHEALQPGELDRAESVRQLDGLALAQLERRDVRVATGDLLERVGVERVDVDRGAGVEAQVAL